MEGTGVPLVTPFTPDGDVDTDAIPAVVDWVLERGVDFLVPCGSTGEAELLSVEERTYVVECIVDAAPDDVPVVAGTGHPSLAETRRQTEQAAAAGADAALVVTPHYYTHDQDALMDYYRALADDAPIPVYLYSMPGFTGMRLDPATVADLATHDGIAGMKDSSGDLEVFQRYRAATRDADFDLLVGSGSIYAAALDAGADGGVLALANVAPAGASEIYRSHRANEYAAARETNERLVELNHAITAEYGIPGCKAAMRARDVPAGQPRSPFQDVDAATRDELAALVHDVLP